MVKLAGAFSQFRPFKALVIGDFMLDAYTTGRVKRISPEAPVPVMEVIKQESRPGGAGNVALNLVALGAKVFAAGRIGSDKEGSELKECLAQRGVDTEVLCIEPNYKTPVKNRLVADSQQLLRIDFETISPLDRKIEDLILEQLEALMPNVQIAAISDYGKGFLTNRVIAGVIEIAKKNQVPVVVDPKGIDFTKYKGASVLKPNLSEAFAAAKLPSSAPLDEVAKQLFFLSSAELLLITRSEAGMSLFHPEGKRTDFPVRSKEVKDVTGAGDTVLAMICLGLANGLDINQSVQLANIAAGIAIERLGCVQVTLSEVAERLLEIDSDTKIFDESQTYALQQVLKGKCYSLLILNKGQEMTNSLFKTLRQLATEEELVVYLRDSHPNDEFVHLLSSLQEVDYLILQTESLKNLCMAIHPKEVYLQEGEQLLHLKPAKDLLEIFIKASHRSLPVA